MIGMMGLRGITVLESSGDVGKHGMMGNLDGTRYMLTNMPYLQGSAPTVSPTTGKVSRS